MMFTVGRLVGYLLYVIINKYHLTVSQIYAVFKKSYDF